MIKKILPLALAAVLLFPSAVFGGETMACDREKIYETVKASDDFLKALKWGEYIAVLQKDRHTVSYTFLGNVWVDISLDYFEESDLPISGNDNFVINDIEVWGDQIFCGCDDGLVIIITECQKCYKLKKVCDFDIKDIGFAGSEVKLTGNADEVLSVPVTDLRQSKISAEEMASLMVYGAHLIDLRDEADYEKGSLPGAVNIPIDRIETIKSYPQGSVFIFFCYGGTRAEKAVNLALEYGFENVYNAGGYDEILAAY